MTEFKISLKFEASFPPSVSITNIRNSNRHNKRPPFLQVELGPHVLRLLRIKDSSKRNQLYTFICHYYKNSNFKNEAKCRTFLVQMSFTCMSFISEALYKPRFETEACGNSEMAYLHGFQQYSFSYPSRAFWHQASSFFSTWKSLTLLSEPVSSITPWTWSAVNKQVSFKVQVHIWRWSSATTQSKVIILKASLSFNIEIHIFKTR